MKILTKVVKNLHHYKACSSHISTQVDNLLWRRTSSAIFLFISFEVKATATDAIRFNIDKV